MNIVLLKAQLYYKIGKFSVYIKNQRLLGKILRHNKFK